jgi:hypothetical protein
VFVVANKLAGDPLADDQRAMLRGLALIKYLQMHHTRVFTAVQLHHPDLMPRVLAAGIDHCTSLTHLTAALLAQSCLVPGFATLALNLVASYSGQVSVDLYDDVDADHWLDEYYYGTSHELYEVLLGDTAVGWSFPALAAHVYATHGICVVGMETAAPSGQGFIIALSPGPSYTVRRGDRALCLARCEADAQHVAWLPSNPSAVSVQHDAIALETCVIHTVFH